MYAFAINEGLGDAFYTELEANIEKVKREG
jgi:hypothetical protein